MIDEAMLLREIAYNLSGQNPQETKAVMQGAASKIDELRSMLAERDAEIGLLNSTLESRDRNIEALHEVSTERRKVLKQALTTLVKLTEQSDCDIDPFTFGRYGGNVAITAIQEVLK